MESLHRLPSRRSVLSSPFAPSACPLVLPPLLSNCNTVCLDGPNGRGALLTRPTTRRLKPFVFHPRNLSSSILQV